MPYEPDLREESWKGYHGHRHAVPHDPAATDRFNRDAKEAELEKARKIAAKEDARREKEAVA